MTDTVSREIIERELRRPITELESQIATVCGPGLEPLASVCIEEGLTVKAATRIADIVREMEARVMAEAARLFTAAAAAAKDGSMDPAKG